MDKPLTDHLTEEDAKQLWIDGYNAWLKQETPSNLAYFRLAYAYERGRKDAENERGK